MSLDTETRNEKYKIFEGLLYEMPVIEASDDFTTVSPDFCAVKTAADELLMAEGFVHISNAVSKLTENQVKFSLSPLISCLYRLIVVNRITLIDKLFVESCHLNATNTCIYLMTRGAWLVMDNKPTRIFEIAIRHVATNGNITLFEILHQTFNVEVDQTYVYALLSDACANNNVERIKYIFDKYSKYRNGYIGYIMRCEHYSCNDDMLDFLISIGLDGEATNASYFGRFLPAKLTTNGIQKLLALLADSIISHLCLWVDACMNWSDSTIPQLELFLTRVKSIDRITFEHYLQRLMDFATRRYQIEVLKTAVKFGYNKHETIDFLHQILAWRDYYTDRSICTLIDIIPLHVLIGPNFEQLLVQSLSYKDMSDTILHKLITKNDLNLHNTVILNILIEHKKIALALSLYDHCDECKKMFNDELKKRHINLIGIPGQAFQVV